VHDTLHGDITADVDDVVLRRNDGVPAYNLAVVVDDAFAGVDQVVRGADLLPLAVSQAFLAELLGHRAPGYAHVPLAVNAAGRRLAKRDGAVTLAELAARGVGSATVLALIAESLDLASPGEQVLLDGLLERFDPGRLPRHPWVVKGLRSARDHLG
jgi:glutamyl-tRNA synthetase